MEKDQRLAHLLFHIVRAPLLCSAFLMGLGESEAPHRVFDSNENTKGPCTNSYRSEICLYDLPRDSSEDRGVHTPHSYYAPLSRVSVQLFSRACVSAGMCASFLQTART